MSKRAAGDVVYTDVGQLLDILSCHVAGAFRHGFSFCHFYGFSHVVDRHVVQHYYLRSGIDGLPDHLQVFRFNFYLYYEGSISAGHLYGLSDTAGGVYMVVLKHDAV